MTAITKKNLTGYTYDALEDALIESPSVTISKSI